VHEREAAAHKVLREDKRWFQYTDKMPGLGCVEPPYNSWWQPNAPRVGTPKRAHCFPRERCKRFSSPLPPCLEELKITRSAETAPLIISLYCYRIYRS
jgi:hypothetical protein